jgi:hypothetical protein
MLFQDTVCVEEPILIDSFFLGKPFEWIMDMSCPRPRSFIFLWPSMCCHFLGGWCDDQNHICYEYSELIDRLVVHCGGRW